MKKILFTTDFDNNAPAMLVYTALFAQSIGARITLFHAYGTGAIQTEEEIIKKGTDSLAALHQLVEQHLPPKFKDIPLEYLVDENYAFDAIPEVASDEAIDFVVLGIKNSQHSLWSMLESTTLDVILDIDCNVLVIPNSFQTERISRLGCTTEFQFRDIALLNRLRDFGKRLGKDTSIHCIHVIKEHSATLDRVTKDMETLYSVFDGRKGPKIHFEMQSGKVAETIEDFAIAKQLDLVVMNSYQRDFIGKMIDKSLSKEIAMDIKIPLLILKDL